MDPIISQTNALPIKRTISVQHQLSITHSKQPRKPHNGWHEQNARQSSTNRHSPHKPGRKQDKCSNFGRKRLQYKVGECSMHRPEAFDTRVGRLVPTIGQMSPTPACPAKLGHNRPKRVRHWPRPTTFGQTSPAKEPRRSTDQALQIKPDFNILRVQPQQFLQKRQTWSNRADTWLKPTEIWHTVSKFWPIPLSATKSAANCSPNLFECNSTLVDAALHVEEPCVYLCSPDWTEQGCLWHSV